MMDFSSAYPSSRKVHVNGGQGVRVPMREIALTGGEPSLRVYDTSGPHGHDVKNGLPNSRMIPEYRQGYPRRAARQVASRARVVIDGRD